MQGNDWLRRLAAAGLTTSSAMRGINGISGTITGAVGDSEGDYWFEERTEHVRMHAFYLQVCIAKSLCFSFMYVLTSLITARLNPRDFSTSILDV